MGRVTVVGGKVGMGAPVTFDPVFANNDWKTIIKACQSNKVPDTWVVGSQKTMTINGADYPIDIIGKNHDVYSDGSGTAPLTFQMHNSYVTKYGMNDTDTTSGGWTSCQMRKTHLPSILVLMPSEVQNGIKEVNKLTSAGSGSSTINTTADKLFLLSEVEVFGTIPNSFAGEGTQYEYYKAGNSKTKFWLSGTSDWWERSPAKINYNYNFCRLDNAGNALNLNAKIALGVAFAFCF